MCRKCCFKIVFWCFCYLSKIKSTHFFPPHKQALLESIYVKVRFMKSIGLLSTEGCNVLFILMAAVDFGNHNSLCGAARAFPMWMGEVLSKALSVRLVRHRCFFRSPCKLHTRVLMKHHPNWYFISWLFCVRNSEMTTMHFWCYKNICCWITIRWKMFS